MVEQLSILVPLVVGAGALLTLRHYMPLIAEAIFNRHRTEEEFWLSLLTGVKPGVPMYWMRNVFGLVRSSSRCKVCNIPFSGPMSVPFRMVWSGQSNLTPHFCKKCEDFAIRHVGGAEVKMSMLFVDVRGSTALGEKLSPTEFRALLNRFYETTTEVLTENGAWLDKFVGDEAIGLFIPGFAGPDHAYLALKAARELLEATGHGSPDGPWIPVGVGVNTDVVFMGTVGSGKVADITALGDGMNTTARLTAAAARGEIVFSEATRAEASQTHADFVDALRAGTREVIAKGKSLPLVVHVVPSRAESAAS